MLPTPISQAPAAISLATSRSPPDGFFARLARTPLSQASVFSGPMMRDGGCDQRGVVIVLARADAELALEARAGEILIGEGGVLYAVLRGVDDAGARETADPEPSLAPQRRRNRLLKRRGHDRLRHAEVDRMCQRGNIHRQQKISRAALAFGLNALGEAGFGEHDIDLHAGFSREFIEQRLDQPRFAMGVEVDFLRLNGTGSTEYCAERQHGFQRVATVSVRFHGKLRSRRVQGPLSPVEKMHDRLCFLRCNIGGVNKKAL